MTNYIAKGQKNLVIVPIAYTSDHIETLFELDEEVIGECGCKDTIKRVESLNGSRAFIEALADLAKGYLEKGEACSKQMGLRCPGCASVKCVRVRSFLRARGRRFLCK